jgi:hypothetical protein
LLTCLHRSFDQTKSATKLDSITTGVCQSLL